LQLAAYELMENVVKYTSVGDGEFQLELSSSDAGCRVFLQTQNRANSEHRRDLEQRMSALSAADDPVTHYDAEIAASARRPFGSGLGLVRIRAEGEMIMGCRVDGEQVVVRVEAAFSRAKELMSDLNLSPVITPVFALEPSLHGDRLQIAFSGTGDMSAIGEFNEYLTKVHGEASALS
jgi:hypothetical protein